MLRTILVAAVSFVLLALVGVCPTCYAQAPLRGELRRTVINPWGVGSTIGWGLATDGSYLFASSNQDGIVRVVDIPTLSIVDTIPTPAAEIPGLTYRDGLLFGVASRENAPSRFFTVDPATHEFNWTFDAPSDGFTSMSFGPDGLLYAADGFDDGRVSGTRIYAFDPDDGSIVRTLRSRVIGEPPDDGDEIFATGLLEWLPGGRLLIDFPVGTQNLNLPIIENEILLPGPSLEVPGIIHPDPRRGAAVSGNKLYFWGFTAGSVRQFYEVEIVPEPSSATLTGAFFIAALTAYFRTKRGAVAA